MQKIFVSYSRKDIDFVRKLAGDLETAGYDVWWDITDLQGGDDWVRKIPSAIAASQYFIIVLSPNSIESEWVRKEYTQALNLRKKIDHRDSLWATRRKSWIAMGKKCLAVRRARS